MTSMLTRSRPPQPCSTEWQCIPEIACSNWLPGRAASVTHGPRLLGVTGRVLISDIAPGMVEVARRRNAALDNVDVAILDASTIDQPDASYDVVACRMGLMFTPDPEVAVAEIHRVLAPGGRFGALTWGPMEHNPWMTCVGMAAMLHGLVGGGPPVGPTRRTGDGRRLRRCEGGRVRRHTPGVRSTRSQLTNFNEQL